MVLVALRGDCEFARRNERLGASSAELQPAMQRFGVPMQQSPSASRRWGPSQVLSSGEGADSRGRAARLGRRNGVSPVAAPNFEAGQPNSSDGGTRSCPRRLGGGARRAPAPERRTRPPNQAPIPPLTRSRPTRPRIAASLVDSEGEKRLVRVRAAAVGSPTPQSSSATPHQSQPSKAAHAALPRWQA